MKHEFSDEDWGELQKQMWGHFLQSEHWADFQRVLGREIVRDAGDGWSYQGIVTQGRAGVRYLYCPYGPTVREEGRLVEVMQSWRVLDVDFVRCEPMGVLTADELAAAGLVMVGEVQPQHTLIVDLGQDEEDLRRALESGHRNTINGAERRGLSFRSGGGEADLELFLRFIHLTAARTGFRPQSDEYFRSMMRALEPSGAAKLFVAEHEGTAVAAAIAYDYAGTRAYAHAGNDPEARKLRVTTPLVWHMMMDAKAKGLTEFDLWGVAPEGAGSEHPWTGFTAFKRAFGGFERTYVGTWELPVKAGRYRIYRLVKRLVGLKGRR